MAGTLFSASWFRVAALRPRLHRHAIFHRHDYRGQTWHVIEDRTAERFHRFAPATYYLIGLMDGERTVDDIWRAAIEKLGDEAPSQDEVIRLLAQLHAADLIRTQTTVEADDLFRRYRSIDRQSWLRWLSAPFSLRAPLLNPDRALDLMLPVLRGLFSVWSLLVWLAVVGAGCVAAATHWTQLTQDVADRLLAPWNLAAVALAYVILKVFHEFGHAITVKAWGGRVQEIGLMFIVFMPVPYVDASAASSFPSKWRRMVVGAAGILVELFFAAVALLLWIDADPGPWRSFLYNIVFLGTVSTLLFNGNPLLKFDGYYILADVLEIPNLAQRAQNYLGTVFESGLLGLRRRDSPVSAPGERLWFILYAPLAAFYRIFLAFSIALFMASEYMLVGVAMGLWALVLMIIAPVLRTFGHILADAERQGRRSRTVGVVGAMLALALALLFVLPVPHSTVAKGISVVPERGSVRAGAEGFVTEVLAGPDQAVTTGTPLVRVSDPIVDAEVKALKAQLTALRARLASLDSGFANTVDAAVVGDEIKSVEEALGEETLRKAEQTILAPTDGIFRLPRAADITGRFVARGETIGFVQDPHRLLVSVVVDQVGLGDIENHVRRVALWADGLDTNPAEARVTLLHPGGLTVLPHAALSVEGGGDFPIDPHRPGELRTLANVFQIDVEPVHATGGPALIGRHYLVRFQHDPEPIGWQLVRAGRRLLLDRFGV